MTLEDALATASSLPADDKLRLIDALARQLLDERLAPPVRGTSSLYGALRGSGPAPSLDDFREARHELWVRREREAP